MASGDVLSFVVQPDGWFAEVVIEGADVGGSYDWGLGVDNSLDDPSVIATITSEGYNSSGALGTVERTVYGTIVRRLTYPNHADSEEVEFAGAVTLTVSLSEFIYDDDVIDNVAVVAGWYTDIGIGPNNATPDVALTTNNSTLDYPKVLGRWDQVAGVMAGDRVKAAFQMACLAFHKFGIAAIIFDADGVTSLNNETETVTTKVTEAFPVTGNYREFYKSALIALTDFDDDELINLNFKAYPVVGDADSVLDSSSFTSDDEECRGWNQAVITCDKGAGVGNDLYAFVDGVGPDDGTVSAVLATAQADPFATVGQAIENGANIIYLVAGIIDAVGTEPSSRVTTDEWIIVQPAPGESKDTVTCRIANEGGLAGQDYKCQRLMFQDLTITLEDTGSALWGEAVNMVRFKGCTFDSSGVGAPTQGPGFSSIATYMQNCDGDLSIANWHITGFSTTHACYVFEGCELSGTNPGTDESIAIFSLVGCTITGQFGIREPTNAQLGPTADGCVFVSNKWLLQELTTVSMFTFGLDQYDYTVGFGFIDNIMECHDLGNSRLIVLGGSSTVIVNNVLLWNNILMGEGCIFGYNDFAVVDRLNWSQIGNIVNSWNTKSDVFEEDGTLIGNWPVSYNVGTRYCIHAGSESVTALGDAFRGDFDGINVKWGTLPTFVDDQSSQQGAGGNGDYHPVVDSPQIDYVASGYVRQAFDLDGVTRATPADAGTYEFVADAPEDGGDYTSRGFAKRFTKPNRFMTPPKRFSVARRF